VCNIVNAFCFATYSLQAVGKIKLNISISNSLQAVVYNQCSI